MKPITLFRYVRTNWKNTLYLVAVLLAFASPNLRLQAQVTTADIVGTVTDESGAAVPGAKVILTNSDTGVVQTVESNGTGEYAFRLLQIGRYSLSVGMKNF